LILSSPAFLSPLTSQILLGNVLKDSGRRLFSALRRARPGLGLLDLEIFFDVLEIVFRFFSRLIKYYIIPFSPESRPACLAVLTTHRNRIEY
jgi:hypothetical protein